MSGKISKRERAFITAPTTKKEAKRAETFCLVYWNARSHETRVFTKDYRSTHFVRCDGVLETLLLMSQYRNGEQMKTELYVPTITPTTIANAKV